MLTEDVILEETPKVTQTAWELLELMLEQEPDAKLVTIINGRNFVLKVVPQTEDDNVCIVELELTEIVERPAAVVVAEVTQTGG